MNFPILTPTVMAGELTSEILSSLNFPSSYPLPLPEDGYLEEGGEKQRDLDIMKSGGKRTWWNLGVKGNAVSHTER